MSDINNLLKVRRNVKVKKPAFIRQDIQKKKRLKKKWRRPKGIQSKIRLNKRGHRKQVEIGYKSPKEVHGMHPLGLKIILVNSYNDINNINTEKEGVIISGTVGMKKKINLMKKIMEKKITILNIKNPEEYLKKVEDILAKKKGEKRKRKEVKEKKTKEKEKKAEKKEGKEKEKGKEELTEKIEKEEKDKEKKEKDKLLTKKV